MQIVTYVSIDAAFGGPVAVAVAQAIELAACGHEVELLAGWDGLATLEAPGVRVRLFRTNSLLPAAGFSGLVAPRLLAHVRANHRSYDSVHIHMSRDLITLPVAMFLASKRAKYVVQSHGTIVPDPRIRARIFDAIAVRRVLERATSVIAYRGVDDDALRAVSRGKASIEFLVNGVESGLMPLPNPATAGEVLFMARLHPRKRVMAFAQMARLLVERGISSRFVVVGPDEGDLAALRAFIATHAMLDLLSYEGAVPYDQVRDRLRRSAVYVLPSVNEPFPVTVLEAMAVGTPCVITDTCGLAPYFEEDTAGLVTDGTPDKMAEAVESLITDSALRDSVIKNAARTVEERFSIGAVVETLLAYYRKELKLT